MPSIMLMAHTVSGGEAAVILAERLTTMQLGHTHFAAQLVERLKSAGTDAEHADREASVPTARIDQARPPGS
jgi:hypothetical protein